MTKEGLFGLSYPLLTKTNYTAWALKMRVFMQARRVWDAVEPKNPEGVPEDVMLSISEKHASKDAWKAVKTMFLGADKVKAARAQTLKSEFEALYMKEDEQLDEFYLKLNSLFTNIRVLGEKVDEAYVVKKLLRAVPSKFLQIASTIEQFGNLEEMLIEEVVSSLKAHEKRLPGTTEKGKGQLLLTEEEWKRKESSEGQLLLTREEWLKKSNIEGTRGGGNTRGVRYRSRVRCFNCQGHGHFTADRRRPRKERDMSREANLSRIQEDESALLIAEVGQTEKLVMFLKEEVVVPKLRTNNEDQKESQVWYLDNGASNHMTGQRGKFKMLDECVSGKVKSDNRSAIELMKNPVLHGRSKHIDVRFHFICECIERGELIVKHVATQEQRADILTKALGRVKFEEMRKAIGVKDLTAGS
ncbi:uncharacterized protein LOC141684982 [Apium graveolens]|uniref:uncharacterized protein LOC141684982 n=1 Tax=Apium graveolens TaxID=4045 RepID=UPI003D7AC6A6